jgi:hypothetical protein
VTGHRKLWTARCIQSAAGVKALIITRNVWGIVRISKFAQYCFLQLQSDFLRPRVCICSDMNAEPVPTKTQTFDTLVLGKTQGFNLAVAITNASWGVAMAGTFQDFAPGEAKVVLEGLVSPGTLVDVQIGSCGFSGEVLFCERRAAGFETHISISDFDETGLRRTPRFPVTLPCVVSSGSLEGPANATILDISGDGLGIEVSAQIPTNSTIAVESESNVALGIVRYSREISPASCRIGVQLHHIVNKKPVSEMQKSRTGMLGKMSSRFSFGLRQH